jgi:hypothetical protein
MSNKPAPSKVKTPVRDEPEDEAPVPQKLAAPPYLRPNTPAQERMSPANNVAEPQCWNCKFFCALPDRSKINDGETPPKEIQGQCRGKPPIPMAVYVSPRDENGKLILDKHGNPLPPEPRFDSYFPIVRGDLWCGDWEPFPSVAASMRH